MTYDELCEETIKAMDRMIAARAISTTIVLSPEAFNTVVKSAPNRPMFFGMFVEVERLPEGVEFIIRQEADT